MLLNLIMPLEVEEIGAVRQIPSQTTDRGDELQGQIKQA
jgi:hypothetical protein